METSTSQMDSAAVAAPDKFESLNFPVELIDIPHPRKPGQSMPGRKSVIRTDTNEVLNIVSNRYPLVKHSEVFGALDEAITQTGIGVLDRKVQTAYSGGYAKVIWTLDRTLLIDDPRFKDDVKVTIHARNSYNYSSLVGIELGAFRLICSNGAMVGRLLARARKRHVPSIRVPDLLKEITSVLEQTEVVQKRWSSWNSIEYSKERLGEWLLNHSLPRQGREAILDYFAVQPDHARQGVAPRMSGWESFNAITWFATHRVTSRRSDTLLLAEERILELAQLFAREELEGKAHNSRN